MSGVTVRVGAGEGAGGGTGVATGPRLIDSGTEGAADAVLSFRSGKIETAPYINTIADGLLTKLGDKTFPIIQQYVTDILTVSDEEIIAALRLVYERMKIIVEPSCVVPLAALLKNKELFAGKRVGIILSGGNVDLKKLGEWFQ